jgi:hypothetical protein
MKIYIDFSIICSGGPAFGNVYGYIYLTHIPPIGSTVKLSDPKNGAKLEISGYIGHFKVENIIFVPDSDEFTKILLSLSDITLKNKDDARKLGRFMEDGFGLFCDEYNL